jgi:hypothetical protein
MKLHSIILKTLLISLTGAAGPALAQHGHLNAGAFGTNQNDQLYCVNGASVATNSGFVRTLDYSNSGTYAGTFNGNITFTALPGTTNNGGPAFGHAALGSFLVAEIVSVDGPAGGVFSFWDSAETSPTHNVPVGTTGGSFQWDLSDSGLGAGQPDGDPFGHIHGRRFSVNADGRYTVGFRALDTSLNGAGSGPIHLASDPIYIYFQTVPEPAVTALAVVGLGAVVGRLWRTRRRQPDSSRP